MKIENENDHDRKWPLFYPRHPPIFTQEKKVCSSDGRTLAFWLSFLYLCTSNRKKASLVPKVDLYRRHIWVSIDVRRRSSMTTKIRARNGASGELKYQPSKHTKSMINYSITMRSVNSNLLIGSICHLLIVAYRPLLYLRNPRAKPFLFGFYNQRFL